MFDSIVEIAKYGLPYRLERNDTKNTARGWNITGIPERAYAELYWLDHMKLSTSQFSPKWDDYDIRFKGVLIGLAKFIIDYGVHTALGEARHGGNREPCSRCNKPFGMCSGQNERAYATRVYAKEFKTYDEAIDALLHTYYDHWWTPSYGGYKWGNTVYVAQRLLAALRANNYAEMFKWVDIAGSLQHNGGNIFNSKYVGFHPSITILTGVLWTKFHGQPCCYEWLKEVAFGSGLYNACEHFSSQNRPGKIPCLNPRVDPSVKCNLCNKRTTVSKVDEHGTHLGACKICGTCTGCIRIGKRCMTQANGYTCIRRLTHHHCILQCGFCGIHMKDFETPHRRCHMCAAYSISTVNNCHQCGYRMIFTEQEMLYIHLNSVYMVPKDVKLESTTESTTEAE